MNDEQLTPEQRHTLREGGTDAPFTGKYVNHHEDGTYTCAGCHVELFSSETKFESGSGWPSFTEVIEQGNVELKQDDSHGMIRTEVLCASCDGHLGHVFDDGPIEKGGKRFCINSSSLNFKSSEK